MSLIADITKETDLYNLHSHTQFCDGHATMEEMASAAREAGLLHYGFSPHSPINVTSGANMDAESVRAYLDETERLKAVHAPALRLYAAMEIDYISPDWGPHTDYFQKMPLDYRIGSVHFVPNQDGIPIDCDGSAERFARYLKEGFQGDLRYVVEKYFEQVLTMLELGGFDMLGHFDKIAQNASTIDPDIESYSWYQALIKDVISHVGGSEAPAVEINTKYIYDKKRFFPEARWWPMVVESGAVICVNSDAHYPDRITNGRDDALRLLAEVRDNLKNHTDNA